MTSKKWDEFWYGEVYDNLGVEALFKLGVGFRDGIDFLLESETGVSLPTVLRRSRHVASPVRQVVRLVEAATKRVRELRARCVVAEFGQSPGTGVRTFTGVTVEGTYAAMALPLLGRESRCAAVARPAERLPTTLR